MPRKAPPELTDLGYLAVRITRDVDMWFLGASLHGLVPHLHCHFMGGNGKDSNRSTIDHSIEIST